MTLAVAQLRKNHRECIKCGLHHSFYNPLYGVRSWLKIYGVLYESGKVKLFRKNKGLSNACL